MRWGLRHSLQGSQEPGFCGSQSYVIYRGETRVQESHYSKSLLTAGLSSVTPRLQRWGLKIDLSLSPHGIHVGMGFTSLTVHVTNPLILLEGAAESGRFGALLGSPVGFMMMLHPLPISGRYRCTPQPVQRGWRTAGEGNLCIITLPGQYSNSSSIRNSQKLILHKTEAELFQCSLVSAQQ